ncbi:polyprenyl synthetase family protein [Streptomyces sp. NBC_00536]|uniref:polyprenyl synthetase family protein n=1 Tax=Streptomyces sp. NBC_00536 TaxID=2975769 RepID=UPI002E81A06D|nr:polyprenyl synthetase family protein [Streptomyces sp. NBC_00536]WUC77524.1 polyprenyl synthetase family protein [Streptomyces sp. NBC_00536]
MSRDVVAFLDPPLRAAVGRLEQPLRGMAEYYFRWVDAEGVRCPVVASTRRRYGSLFLLAAGGGEQGWERARNAAAAGTLLLASVAVHDDIIDEEPVRNGRPTVHAVFGVPAALYVGNALVGLASELLAEEPSQLAGELGRRLAEVVREIANCQILDVRFGGSQTVTLQEALTVSAAKIAPGTAFACAAGALCAGASPAQVEAAAEVGSEFGKAWALWDELEEYAAGDAAAAVDRLADLRQRRIVPSVAYALQSQGPAREKLLAYFHDSAAPDNAGLLQARDLVEECGALTWLRERLDAHLARALHRLPDAVVDPVARAEFASCLRSWALS